MLDDDGRVVTGSLLDYALPTSDKVPPIETVLLEVPSQSGPFGVRGVGEPPVIPGAAAIGNAIRDAVGVRLTEIPMTAETPPPRHHRHPATPVPPHLTETAAPSPFALSPWERAARAPYRRCPIAPRPRLYFAGERLMSFTIEDFKDLIELLAQHPEWRAGCAGMCFPMICLSSRPSSASSLRPRPAPRLPSRVLLLPRIAPKPG